MTSEQKRKAAWLNRAFYAEKKSKALLAKLERDRSIAERLSKCCDGGAGVSGTSDNSTEDALIRLADTEQKTQEQLRELVRVRDEIVEAIQQIDEPDLQAVLYWHYLNYFTFEQIAVKMHYDERTIRRKHKKALDKIVL